MRAIFVEFFTVLVCTNVGLGRTYANDRGLSEESLHCGDSSDDFDSGEKTSFQDSPSYHPKPRYDSTGGSLNLNLPSKRFDSFNSINTQKRSAVMVPSPAQTQLAKRQPFQRSYRFIPVREEAPSAVSSGEALEPSNPLQDLVYQQGGLSLEKREINAKTREVKTGNGNNNYPSILAKFRIKSKLEKSDYITSSSGRLEKRNSLFKILAGSDSSSSSSSSSLSSGSATNGLRGVQELGSAKSRIRRKSHDNTSGNNGGHIEEKLKNILDDMGLIDNTNLIDDLDGRSLKREVANKQKEPIKEDSDDSSLSIGEEDTNGDANRNKRDSNNACGSTAKNPQLQWSTENPLNLLSGKNNLFNLDNIKNPDDGSLSSLRKRQSIIESPVDQSDDDGTEKNSRNKREKSQGKDDLDIVESLKESGDLTFSGNKSPLASSSDINTRDDRNSKISKAHSAGNSKHQDEYEKRVEREIQDKIETLKDEVKREIAALKQTRSDDLDSQRKKRQTSMNLLDEESDSVNPVLNPSSEELKPLVRKRRSASLGDQETASVEELKPLVVKERSADLSFFFGDPETSSNEEVKTVDVKERSADLTGSLADQETASNEELKPLIVEERAADSTVPFGDPEPASSEELKPIERKERSADSSTSSSDKPKSLERQQRTVNSASLGDETASDQNKRSNEELKSSDRQEKSTDFSASLTEKTDGQNLRTDRSADTTASLASAETGDQEETKLLRERSADLIDLFSDDVKKRSADLSVPLNDETSDEKNEELKPLKHQERSADQDGSTDEELKSLERKERSTGDNKQGEVESSGRTERSGFGDEAGNQEKASKELNGPSASLSGNVKDTLVNEDLKPSVRKRRSLGGETSDQENKASNEFKSSERREKSTDSSDGTKDLDVSLDDDLLKRLVRKRRSSPLADEDDGELELLERQTRSLDSVASPGEDLKSAERKKRSAADFDDSLTDETNSDQDEKCPGGGGGGTNLDSARLKREGLGKEDKDPTGANRRYSKNFDEEPENSFDTLGHFSSLEKRELKQTSGGASAGDRQRRWRQGFGNQNRNAQLKKESLKESESEDSCSDLSDEDSAGKDLKRQSLGLNTNQKEPGEQQNLNSAETNDDDYDRIKRFNEADQYDEDSHGDFYEDTDRLKRENFDDYDMHEARPSAGGVASQQQPIIDEERPRYRRRISEEQDSLNRPQQLSDMSDLDLFGALPKSYDGELSRYKRVKRRRRDDGKQ